MTGSAMQEHANAYWRPPCESPWWTFIVDGKVVATVEETATVNRERKRLKGLRGIEIVPASAEQMIQANASTTLPKRITRRMSQLYDKSMKIKNMGGGK